MNVVFHADLRLEGDTFCYSLHRIRTKKVIEKGKEARRRKRCASFRISEEKRAM